MKDAPPGLAPCRSVGAARRGCPSNVSMIDDMYTHTRGFTARPTHATFARRRHDGSYINDVSSCSNGSASVQNSNSRAPKPALHASASIHSTHSTSDDATDNGLLTSHVTSTAREHSVEQRLRTRDCTFLGTHGYGNAVTCALQNGDRYHQGSRGRGKGYLGERRRHCDGRCPPQSHRQTEGPF